MMVQRKLTAEELADVMQARHYLRVVMGFALHSVYGGCVLSALDEVASHCTTDGKPWHEPEPEIGEGYRLATEADTSRLDLDVVIDGKWVATGPGVLKGFRYRVPVDRIPTDEDAKQRPTVMVRDNDDQVWYKTVLIAVSKGDEKPFYEKSFGKVDCWRQARFPYPGELP